MGNTLRRTLALTTTMTLLGGLAVITTAAPAAAQLTCGGKLVTWPGTEDVDIINGTPGDDVIHGLGGDDTIIGNGGDDTICGGDGEDRITGDEGDDIIYGGGRKDTILGGDGEDLICGGFGPDILHGNGDIDTVEGGPGRDRIWGEQGQDYLFGYASFCPERGPDARDIIRGGKKLDFIWGGPGPDILYGQDGPDFIRGNKGRNRIDGGPADDDCLHGPTIRRCERADLAVRMRCPAEAPESSVVECRVRVTNNGPMATTYSVRVSEDSLDDANCSTGGGDIVRRYSALRPGRSRSDRFDVDCRDGTGRQKVWAIVSADAHDPKGRNNRHDRIIQIVS